MGRIWAICSGTGGVGKTTLSLSLAAYAAKQGKSVILLDAAGTSRACDLALGLQNVVTLDVQEVLTGQVDIKSALYPVQKYGSLYLACTSLYDSDNLNELSGVLLALQSICDLLVIDLPTACVMDSLDIMSQQDSRIFVVRPDDASVRATDQLLQRVRVFDTDRYLVVNRTKKDLIKRGIQYTADAVTMTLDCPVIGTIFEDERFTLWGTKDKIAFDSDAGIRRAVRDVANVLFERL